MVLIKIVVVLVAIISVAAVVALFTKNKYTLTRDIVINRAKNDVFAFIRLNKNQKMYSKWLSLDPNTKIGLRGAEDGTPGSILTFESNDNKAGTGEWETKKIVEDERIEFELRFLKPFAFVANGYFSTDRVADNQTKVTWVYHSGMDWPVNFMLLFLDMDKLVGHDIQTSLHSLKRNLEN